MNVIDSVPGMTERIHRKDETGELYANEGEFRYSLAKRMSRRGMRYLPETTYVGSLLCHDRLKNLNHILTRSLFIWLNNKGVLVISDAN